VTATMTRHAAVRGFTLIEMLVVMVVLAILASVALPLAEMEVKRSREAELQRALWELRDAIDAYHAAYASGRLVQRPGSSGYPPDLRTLVDGVPDAIEFGKTHYFLRRLPRDPMVPDVAPERVWGLRSYASAPNDPRPGDDVYDVFSQSTAVALDGRPYRSW
jgi:general secretion pathway protein G